MERKEENMMLKDSYCVGRELACTCQSRSHRRGDWKSSVSKARLLRTKDCLQSDEEIALRLFSSMKLKVEVVSVWKGKD
jgi:hypothetical protein